MRVPLEEIFLDNRKVEKDPQYQRGSPFYKQVRDSIKKKGMINPLLVSDYILTEVEGLPSRARAYQATLID